ncbi:MAG: hypothetical protein ACI8RZ_003237 [Myxococcota bacterium]
MVKADPARFGHLYSTTPDQRQTARVRIDEFVYGEPNDWTAGIARILPVLRGLVPDGIMDHTLPAFSTATPESEVALRQAFWQAIFKRDSESGGQPDLKFGGQSRLDRSVHLGVPRVGRISGASGWCVLSEAVLTRVVQQRVLARFSGQLNELQLNELNELNELQLNELQLPRHPLALCREVQARRR